MNEPLPPAVPDEVAPDRLRRLPVWASAGSALLGGLLLDTAFPGIGWWPAALLGAPLVFLAVWQQCAARGALAGALAGAAFWLPHISWLTLYLGPVPWLGLSGLMIAWFALFGIATGVATRALASFPLTAGRPGLGVAAQSLVAAGLWVLREQVQGSWPYGGFPWGLLAHTQAESPLAQSVSWLGFSGLSGLIALAAALPVAALLGGSRPRRLASAGAAALALIVALAVVPAAHLEPHGTLRIAAVQGASKSGIFDDRENGDVLADHLRASELLLDRLEARGERVDLIVWPENSAEFGLPDNRSGSARIQGLARRAEAPIVVGTILRDPDGSYTNSSLVWTPSGAASVRYDKRFPVPFAEYMPNREFYRSLAPELVDLVQLEYTAGQRPPAFAIETAAGEIRAGLAICFDIIFDEQVRAMADAGAELILAQTNNADFGRTDESAQQLAIARLRAIESGRALVNISTVGTSAIVAPDGADLARIEPSTADALVADVPLVTGRTPALAGGGAVGGVFGGLGVAGLAIAVGAPAGRVLRRAGQR